jgi:hypothetical protein
MSSANEQRGICTSHFIELKENTTLDDGIDANKEEEEIMYSLRIPFDK